ncbi:MAG: molybdopterin-guanine dinucleotide biosynthesis protein B [Defluviitaleaceae bacterium]|nr:molybdopterin-guanine dinucleotide biosynthesis protein B [Defluviitaleaceae bacterium]
MKKKLTELFADFNAISIIGMSKNAGKTTVLGKLIDEWAESGMKVGLTSIGRDGEDVDIVTGTEKPRIFVTKDTIIATAADLLKKSDITKEVLKTTGINTPMGEVVFVKARSDGYVQIGGSSIGSQIVKLLEDFKELGADKVLVDGAISRKTLSSPVITDATILCSGASLSSDMVQVVKETAFAAKLLTLKPICDNNVLRLIDQLPDNAGKIVGIEEDYRFSPVSLDNPHNGNRSAAYIYIRGAVSDSFANKFIMSNINLRGVTIIVEDGSKLFITEKTFEKFNLGNAKIAVRRSINLIAVTINPVSVRGFSFDKDAFREALKKELKIPIYNVLD